MVPACLPSMAKMSLTQLLIDHRHDFHPVVPFDANTERLYPFDFTEKNRELNPSLIADTESFARYILQTLRLHHCRYGIGGYGEHRILYARSTHFDEGQEPRRVHLGTDIWGPAGTKVMVPLDGIVHSFGFNNNDSDYGATIILSHRLGEISFHTLYGHLSLNSLKNLQEGARLLKGEVMAEFGMRFENGNWPPHLHFQLIEDMGDWKGDYPGVCRFSQQDRWLQNSPDPDLILQMGKYLDK